MTPDAPRASSAPALATLSLLDLFAALNSSREGLSELQARTRLRATPGTRHHTWQRIRATFEPIRAALDPLVVILLVAGGASAVLGQFSDAILIAGIVLLSSGLNAWQSHRSAKAVANLRSRIGSRASVLRDAAWTSVSVDAVAVGDVVRLAAGDIVPADARLLEARDLHVQQSLLTGEALPAEKQATLGPLPAAGPDTKELVYLGTSIVSGSALALVFATGPNTAFGDIAARLAERPLETEFERGTRRFGLLILQTVVFLVLFILIVHIALGRDPLQSLLFSVALAVGLTPGFLPMITTVTLAAGALQMARSKVIVKHLPSIQNLGSIDILCSDKTGTLTRGSMSLAGACDGLGNPSPATLELATLNSRFESGIQSPLDSAILEQHCPIQGNYEKTDELPFDFERRRLSVVVNGARGFELITKGAPEGVSSACSSLRLGAETVTLDETLRAQCLATFNRLSEDGLRVIAVASKVVPVGTGFTTADERELTLMGFLSFADHPLEGVGESIEQLRRDGVAFKILTGDNELVTRHVCRAVGLDPGDVVLGSELDRLGEAELGRLAERSTVFARLSPAQKHRVITALRAAGHVVGYIGDGINDAPSLHAADVGISVAGAADVARESSDIVLLEPHLNVLHAGILAGRRSFANVLKYLIMGTSSNFGNMFSMALAALFLPFLPMLPTQILLNNLLYDVSQITIPNDRVDNTYLERPPRWSVNLIRRFMLVLGPISSLYDLVTFWVLLRYFDFGEAQFHTGWFVESISTQTLVLFVIRTRHRPWSRGSSRPSLALVTTTLSVVALALVLPFTPLAPWLGFEPLPWTYFVFLALVVFSYLVVVELVKHAVFSAGSKARLPAYASARAR